MADRKSLNHYYPPDFDPSKIPRRRAPKDAQQPVRLMAPYSMRCLTCSEYIYKGKKFNARKELVTNEDYYGIKIFRFYIKCPQCSAEITFKTDPKNADYTAEHGASRNFVPTKDEEEKETGEDGELLTEEEKLERKRERMEGDPMKQLEERTLDSRREMEILDALQDIRTRNARIERVDAESVLARIHGSTSSSVGPSGAGSMEKRVEDAERALAEEEDEALVQKYFGKALDTGATVKRKLEEEETDAEPDIATLIAAKVASSGNGVAKPIASSASAPVGKKKKSTPNAFGLVRKKK